jgi:hypothetical protein
VIIQKRRVAITNSILDGHIAPVGWLVKTRPSNVTFVEANNTEPGYVSASRITQVQIATDFCEKLFDSLQQYVKSSHLSNCFIDPFAG